MIKDIVTLEAFRMLAEEVAKEREKEFGSPCLVAACPQRRTKCCSAPPNVVQFKPRRPRVTAR